MDIKEMINKKEELDTELKESIKIFETSTGLAIRDLRLHNAHFADGHSELIRVECDARLE